MAQKARPETKRSQAAAADAADRRAVFGPLALPALAAAVSAGPKRPPSPPVERDLPPILRLGAYAD
jgi:hypothetical protein